MAHDNPTLAAALDALRTRGPAQFSLWKHRNGTTYMVHAVCVIEATLTPAVVYREVSGQPLRFEPPRWVRPLDEFLDGRFTPADAAK